MTGSFDVFFDLSLTEHWANNRDTGDVRRHYAQYDVIVMPVLVVVDSIALDSIRYGFSISFNYSTKQMHDRRGISRQCGLCSGRAVLQVFPYFLTLFLIQDKAIIIAKTNILIIMLQIFYI